MTGIRAGMDFLQAVRRENSLRVELEARDHSITIDDLVELAQAHGFDLTARDLQRAYATDWQLREHYYSGNVS